MVASVGAQTKPVVEACSAPAADALADDGWVTNSSTEAMASAPAAENEITAATRA